MLELRAVDAYYGTVQALRQVSLTVAPGEIVCLIGANGAGKTSTVRAIAGLVAVRGSILFEGKPIHGLPPNVIVRRGIGVAPEGRRIFPGLTVLENLRVAIAGRAQRDGVAEDLEWIMSLFPALRERGRQLGWSLSGGEQQMLCIGRALMTRPRYLLLDEPSLGLAPRIVTEVLRTVQTINAQGTAILLVEQNARLALKFAHRAYVLQNGQVVQSGPAEELRKDPLIQSTYLGAV